MGSQRRQESGVHAPVPPVCGQSGGDCAADELGSLDLVAVLLVVNGGRDRLGHLIGGASINWIEFPGGLRIKHVVLVTNGDLRLLPCNFEMVVAFLEHFPEDEMRGVAMSGHAEGGHSERIGLNL